MLFKQQEAIIVHYPLWPTFLWRSFFVFSSCPSFLSSLPVQHCELHSLRKSTCGAHLPFSRMSAFYMLRCSLLFIHLPGNCKECWMPVCEITPNISVRPNKQNMHHFSSGFCWSPLMSLKLSAISHSEKSWITINCITHSVEFSKRQKWVIRFIRNEQMWAIWCYFLAGLINSLGKKCTKQQSGLLFM